MRTTEAAPPIGVRSAMTDVTLESASLMVQARVEVVEALAAMDAGEKVQDDTEGGEFWVLTSSWTAEVAAAAAESVAVTVM